MSHKNFENVCAQFERLMIKLLCDQCHYRFTALWDLRTFVGNHPGWSCPRCQGRCGATTWHLATLDAQVAGLET